MMLWSGVESKILVEQEEALKDENTMVEILSALDQQIERKEDGGLYFLDRIWIPLEEHERRMNA